jgi:hypothetical protein
MESRMQMLAGYIFVSVQRIRDTGIETRRHRKLLLHFCPSSS